jgi:hypothetical protein
MVMVMRLVIIDCINESVLYLLNADRTSGMWSSSTALDRASEGLEAFTVREPGLGVHPHSSVFVNCHRTCSQIVWVSEHDHGRSLSRR